MIFFHAGKQAVVIQSGKDNKVVKSTGWKSYAKVLVTLFLIGQSDLYGDGESGAGSKDLNLIKQ
jgi:hypothetical protein